MISNSRVAYHPHDHQRCISAALSKAEALCESRNVRLTPIRKLVLETIWHSHQPLGAYVIVEKLNERSGKRILPPTVYRAIEFLKDLELVHRLPSLNAYIGCPFPGSNHSNLFLICHNCGNVAECSTNGVNKAITETAKRTNFKLESQSLEVFGLCPKCQALEPIDS